MRSTWVRVAGVVLVASAGVAARTLGTRTDPFNGHTGTIYPWWTWALVAAAGCAGLVLLVAPRLTAAAAVALVVGAQLAGTGLVAVRHWRPAVGMGVPGEADLPQLVQLAGLLALAGTVMVVAAGAVLLAIRRSGQRPAAPQRALLISLAVGTAAVVPALAVAADPEVMSWGAAGLMSAGPWAVALALAAATPVRIARALVTTAAASTVVVAVGPHMANLAIDSRVAWLVGAGLALVAAASVWVRREDGTPRT